MLLCHSRSLWRRAWQDRASQNYTRPARPRPRPQCARLRQAYKDKTKTRPRLRQRARPRPRPNFLVSDRSCPKTDGLGPHHWQNSSTQSEQLWYCNIWNRSVLVWVQPRFHFMGRGPSDPQIFETSYRRAHGMRNNNQILHSDQTRCEDIFTRSTTNADARSVCDS